MKQFLFISFLALVAFKSPSKDQLQPVFDQYFLLKDALVKTDGTLAADKSSALLKTLDSVDSKTLTAEAQAAWTKLEKDLRGDAANIAATSDPVKQRSFFITLSKNMYELIKTAKPAEPVYYQFCPMANGGKGANWLSRESAIKNPYYGNRMLTCGRVVETIKP